MKIYIKKYIGYYCAGGCLIVIANNHNEAEDIVKEYNDNLVDPHRLDNFAEVKEIDGAKCDGEPRVVGDFVVQE